MLELGDAISTLLRPTGYLDVVGAQGDHGLFYVVNLESNDALDQCEHLFPRLGEAAGAEVSLAKIRCIWKPCPWNQLPPKVKLPGRGTSCNPRTSP